MQHQGQPEVLCGDMQCPPVALGFATVPLTGTPLLSKNTLAPALNLGVLLAGWSVAPGRLAPAEEAPEGMSAAFCG